MWIQLLLRILAISIARAASDQKVAIFSHMSLKILHYCIAFCNYINCTSQKKPIPHYYLTYPYVPTCTSCTHMYLTYPYVPHVLLCTSRTLMYPSVCPSGLIQIGNVLDPRPPRPRPHGQPSQCTLRCHAHLSWTLIRYTHTIVQRNTACFNVYLSVSCN